MRPTLNVLSQELLHEILGEAKRIMAETGMEIRGKNLRQRLLDHGLKTDDTGKRVLFSADVVDAAIASTPASFTLFNRDGDPYTEIGGYNVHYVPGSSGLKIQDHRTGETRLANSTDFVEYARLCDGLEHIAYLATAFSTNDDIESQVSDAWRLYMTLTTSKKPVVTGAFSEHGVSRMVAMQQLFRSDRAELIEKPLSIFTITATGNFRYGEDSCQNLLDCVEAGIPVEIVPVTLMGLIAPVTLVGALVFHCVDVLTGLTMAQIIRPGAPVLFGGAPATFHMKAASSPMAAIEAQHLNVAYVAIAKSLDLPTQAYMALSDGKFLDAQGGGETFSSALLAALAGVNSVSGPGMLDFVLTFSLPKLVFDNEICGQCLHFVKDLQTRGDLPTDELVAQLMRDDHLITAPHTLEHWPQELYLTDPVIDRANRETWEETGSLSLYDRACQQVEERLANYTPVATDPAIDAALRQLVKDGLEEQEKLPELPPPPEPRAPKGRPGRRGRAGRRRAR
ncbi:MAG: trimethylamine methyltransferase family protein [Gammaproteobacteria bacterium]|nr:trimethylamine methyltransferase family protein [Gammaproteobacteria bacterium]MDH3751206.1 trimethylamine methyltransferase family protein [Gammaproteobacteria bacterium]MDH3804519.1 trimethylamine methyltransferase family protein [Gammaproteobacteria bacterium]